MRGRRVAEITKQTHKSGHWPFFVAFLINKITFCVLDMICSSAYIQSSLHAALILVKMLTFIRASPVTLLSFSIKTDRGRWQHAA